MSRFELPEGVPSDNSSQSLSGGGQPSFVAPDMATPSFAKPRPETGADYSRVVVVVEDEEDEDTVFETAQEEKDDDDDISIPTPPMSWMVIAGIGLALVMLAYFVTNRNTGPQPYCSQQPTWNQYNCIPG